MFFLKLMTNIQNYSNQMEKFSSKITVLVCMTTSDSYGSPSENFLIAAVLNPSFKSRFISKFSRFNRIIKFGHWKMKNVINKKHNKNKNVKKVFLFF